MRFVTSFLRDDRGMETVEWAVMGALLVAGLIATIGAVGGNVVRRFQTIQTATR